MASARKSMTDRVKSAIWSDESKAEALPVGTGGARRRSRIDERVEEMERGTPDRLRRNQTTDSNQ